MNFVSVSQADEILKNHPNDFGEEEVYFENALGRRLAEDIMADRDFPPFDRVTMDGVALAGHSYLSGNRQFKIEGICFAGEPQGRLHNEQHCLEVMTGAPLPAGADTVIRYEDVTITEGVCTLKENLKPFVNIHQKRTDRKKGELILKKDKIIMAADIALFASVGKQQIRVKKRPKIAIITSGDELVAVEQTPADHQIRKSNSYAIASVIKDYCEEIQYFHIADKLDETIESLEKLKTEFQVMVLSGGVSAGKKDFIPEALERLGIQKRFHKIQQKPGKPMWFGHDEQTSIFALPGNPVSAFLGAVRYLKPWLSSEQPEHWAKLGEELILKAELTYFAQVKIVNKNGELMAYPMEGHGSGDFANLSETHAFLELPLRQSAIYQKGEVFRFWPYSISSTTSAVSG